MHPDLERLIHLQTLDLEVLALKRTIDTEAERRQAIEAALETQRAALAEAREQLAQDQHARREIEKDLAQVQSRLSRYKDQLMAVKTNKEYHAMQTEIAAAEGEVQRLEDLILERMVHADDIAARIKGAEADLRAAEEHAKAEVAGLAKDVAAARQRLESAGAERTAVAGTLPAPLLAQYETLLSRRGSAVAEARGGHCSVCHVRLRPQVYQVVRRNESILHCDSCQRILFSVPTTQATAPQDAP